MLRFLWKCVLEVLPPTCATVVAGILLSAYHDHILPLQDVIDPVSSFGHVADPVLEGGKQEQAVIAQVPSERAADPAGIDSKAPAPGSAADLSAPTGAGHAADGRTPAVADAKPEEAAATNAQAAQLNAVLMASSPMSQPPAEIRAAQPSEPKSQDSVAADGRPVVPAAPAEAVPDVSTLADKPAATASPVDQAITSVLRPRFSRHVPKPAHKATSFKAEAERLPPPLVAMVPLPPPAAPPMVSMEAAPQIPPNRSVLRSHAPPTRPQVVGSTSPQVISPTPPQEIGPIPPAIVPNVGVVGAAGSTSAPSLPGAPPGGPNPSQEGKPSEPKRVFGVPIPSTIAAVGDALDPRPVLSAGQRAFDKIVMTAKSVVPDFRHEQ
jgi:hypothetical protein